MTADHNSVDALMAAITGEELPEEARADAALTAEHRRATADVALLRRQLGIIADALAEEPTEERTPAAVRPPREWLRVRRFAFGSLAVAAVATVLSGLGWLLVQANTGVDSMSGGSADSASKADRSAEAGSAFSSPGYLACTRLVAEGEVTAVQPVHGSAGQERITLNVTRSYKPEKSEPEKSEPEKSEPEKPEPERSKKEITLLIEDETLRKALHKGDHILVAVPPQSAVPDYVIVGEKSIAHERAGLTRALPESAEVTC